MSYICDKELHEVPGGLARFCRVWDWYLCYQRNVYIGGLILLLFCFLSFYPYTVIWLSQLNKYLEPTPPQSPPLLLSLPIPLFLYSLSLLSLSLFRPHLHFYTSSPVLLLLSSGSPLNF
jgi:hypothetical protein